MLDIHSALKLRGPVQRPHAGYMCIRMLQCCAHSGQMASCLAQAACLPADSALLEASGLLLCLFVGTPTTALLTNNGVVPTQVWSLLLAGPG